MTQYGYIVVAFECENATVLERIDGMLRQFAGVGGKANRIALSVKTVADRIDDVVACRIRLNVDSGNREGVTWVKFLNRQMCEAFFDVSVPLLEKIGPFLCLHHTSSPLMWSLCSWVTTGRTRRLPKGRAPPCV